MGYGYYLVHRNGQQIEAGYLVPDICNEDDCYQEIDRGLDCLCGRQPGGDEYGCGGYYCDSHLYFSRRVDEPEMCKRCLAAADAEAMASYTPEAVALIEDATTQAEAAYKDGDREGVVAERRKADIIMNNPRSREGVT
ncbi:hypothetical protein [Microbispora sp. NPDC049125]|uniref:hypothetical protein n=1 Tax=Microbispora sp. NPDC049125 TaxID=3154929 RepID=UPI0034671C37